ncbi:MAG: TRAM domain-containing protein [Phycisphaerae bacterium]|nr:TRAM domain-containing protein [Phycisphaerae bacterium]
MALVILRCVFLMVAAGLGTFFVTHESVRHPVWVFVGIMLMAAIVLALDIFVRRKRLDTISAVYFGLLVGIFLTYVVCIALMPLLQNAPYSESIQLLLGMILSYLCISLLMQTKDGFRFIIPYIEFSKEVKGLKPYLLDTSVVIDGRIADLIETSILDNQLIMPRFVLSELQGIADSSDKMRRNRGRRGLDVLDRLRKSKNVEFKIYDREHPDSQGQPVDMRLVLLAKHLEGKIVTGDYNLNKVARLHNVPVINLNDVANSLKPVFLPGEKVEVRVVKPGEEPGQGIGYLDDGTMIVIENGRSYIGTHVILTVTSVLQTSAGRMIFGRFEETARANQPT